MRETLQITSTAHRREGHSLNADGSFVAVASKESVDIVDFKGNVLHQIKSDASHDIFATQWNSSATVLAIVYSGHGEVLLWNRHNDETLAVDIGFKDPSFFLWSPHGDVYVLGTTSGNLIIYDIFSHRIETILGKHSAKITCGAWIMDSMFILGSGDGTATISAIDGQSLQSYSMSSPPQRISCVDVENSVYVALDNGKEMSFLSFDKNDKHVQGAEIITLPLPSDYGESICHFWELSSESIILITSSGHILKVLNPFVTGVSDEIGLFDFILPSVRCCKSSFQEQMFLYISKSIELFACYQILAF